MSRISRGLLLALFLTVPVLFATAESRPSRRTTLPNLVLVVADDLRPGDLDPANPRGAETPHLDQLLAEGLRFTNAYAGAPDAAAARAALMTGQHTGRSRVRSGIQEPLAPADITLAEVVRSAGYRSAMVGQWGLGWEGTTGIPTSQGFNEFLGTLDLAHGADDRAGFVWRNEIAFSFSNASQARRSDSPLAWLMRGASNFVRIHEDGAFLLVYAPHLPGKPPVAALPGDLLNDRYTNAIWSAQERIRAARIARLDQEVGRLMDDLDRRSLSSDTVVVLTSVPGFEPPGVSPSRTGPGTGPWRTGDSKLFEGDLRVPFILRWPGHIPPGVTNVPVAAWDLLPTLAGLAGAPVPATATGRSVAGAWTGKEIHEGTFYWEHHGTSTAQAGRLGPWKAIRPRPGDPVELYHLTDDPGESRNVSQEHPDLVQQFQKLFAAQFRPWNPPADGAIRAAGRPGNPVPTNFPAGPVRTNFLPVAPGQSAK